METPCCRKKQLVALGYLCSKAGGKGQLRGDLGELGAFTELVVAGRLEGGTCHCQVGDAQVSFTKFTNMT